MDTNFDLDDELTRIAEASRASSYETDVVQFLYEVESEYNPPDPQWEYYLGRLAGIAPRKLIEMETYIEDDIEFPQDFDVSFPLYFALTKVHIQRENQGELQRLSDEYADMFTDESMNGLILSQSCLVRSGLESRTLEHCLSAIRQYPTHPGALNHLGIIIVERFERGFREIRNDNLPDTKQGLLQYAEESLKEAIEYEPDYAIYHSTLGRILAEKGRFSAARSSLEKAIRLEDRDKKDGPIRISKYHQFLTNIDIKEQQEEFEQTEEKIDEAKEQIDEFQTRTLEFLGFFAALLTVAVTSVSISTGFPFTSAARLILILIGGMLIAFSGLGFVLPRREKGELDIRPLFVGAIGAFTILLGFFLTRIVEMLLTQ